jgi:hypothetical protein
VIPPPHKVSTRLGCSAVQTFAACDRMNQILIEHLDPAAWNEKPPGKVRTIAAIFTHVHNVRTKWIRLSAPHLKIPTQLNRARCSSRPVRHEPKAQRAARRCCLKRLTVMEAASRSFGKMAVAGRRGNAGLHAFARGTPPRAGVHARASARISAAEGGHSRNLELGEAMEGLRRSWTAPGTLNCPWRSRLDFRLVLKDDSISEPCSGRART